MLSSNRAEPLFMSVANAAYLTSQTHVAPCVNGNGNNGIITLSVAQSLLHVHGDRTWLQDQSVQNFFSLSAPDIAPVRRKYVNLPEYTHFIEVADGLVNERQIDHIPKDVRAFGGCNHDYVEFMNKKGQKDVTPEYVVRQCWAGDPKHIPYLVRLLTLATDPEALHGKVRIEDQARIAYEEHERTRDPKSPFHAYHGFYGYLRFYDKWCTYGRELWALKNRQMSLPTKESAERCLEKLQIKADLVRDLPVSGAHKEAFAKLKKNITREVKAQIKFMERKEGALVKAWRSVTPSIVRRLVDCASKAPPLSPIPAWIPQPYVYKDMRY